MNVRYSNIALPVFDIWKVMGIVKVVSVLRGLAQAVQAMHRNHAIPGWLE